MLFVAMERSGKVVDAGQGGGRAEREVALMWDRRRWAQMRFRHDRIVPLHRTIWSVSCNECLGSAEIVIVGQRSLACADAAAPNPPTHPPHLRKDEGLRCS